MHARWTIALACLVALAAPAYAAGGGGGGGEGGGGGGGDDISASSSDPDFRAGMIAVRANDWAAVVERLQKYVERDPKNADAQNELGHAYRKLGDMDNSFRHYQIALQIDPNHRNAREYLGEAYLQVGNLAQAEQQLKALDRICFLPCEQYTDLKDQIARYKREHPQAASLL